MFPGTKPESITPSEIPGLYEVVVGPTVFYMSGDGRYLIQGKMIDVEGHADVSERSKRRRGWPRWRKSAKAT
ncbi:disulfide isomerase DsbC N-terminal domain-containing protein [Methylogaea oryzae]|uniref:disulfide isomerase DsbC N-terminal domain-containing protein n=1 Tax=Methylogaea oryzae TaxID=1295382 RepID=UPI00278C5126|nr:disulfide isomerase DsbC N-terminal domain-containing protein [Methylogaea oryzae]